MLTQTEIVGGLFWPEALRWHENALWFSDVFGKKVWQWDDEHLTQRGEFEDYPCGLGWLPGGDVIVVSMYERTLLRVDAGGTSTVHADLSVASALPLNDMVMSSTGTAYVGAFGYDIENGEDPRPGPIYRVDPAGGIHVDGPEATFPNGIVLDMDEKYLLVAETFRDRVLRFEVDDSGRVLPPTVLAALPADSGPDGLWLSNDGTLWVACAASGSLLAIDSDGNVESAAEFPDEGCYCVAGDDASQTLYVALAHKDEEVALHTATGRIVKLSRR